MKRKKSISRTLLVVITILLGVVTLTLVTCNVFVVNNARGKAFDEIDSLKWSKVGLLLGTTPQTRIGNRSNMFFKYRIDATVELYKAHKISYILISGDENSLDGVNEVECMRDSLIARGIPEYVIFLDGKGYRTLDSVVRACKVYRVFSITIISQRFHNERALYLAEHLGLDVDDLQAYNAKDPSSVMSMMTYIREYIARVKMFLDIWRGNKPTVTEPYNSLRMLICKAHKKAFGRCYDSIFGHNEQDTIVGNFTGNAIDTLFVKTVSNPKYKNDDDWKEPICRFYLSSSNKNIPDIEIYGCGTASPLLVNEGDLDGNGTCEVGYIHIWTTSQWRYYRIFTLVNNEWRYLLKGDYLDTSEYFRESGFEVAEPGKEKGTVLVHYLYEGYDDAKGKRVTEIRDTIVRPTFDEIRD